jgi:hypothetical protein
VREPRRTADPCSPGFPARRHCSAGAGRHPGDLVEIASCSQSADRGSDRGYPLVLESFEQSECEVQVEDDVHVMVVSAVPIAAVVLLPVSLCATAEFEKRTVNGLGKSWSESCSFGRT